MKQTVTSGGIVIGPDKRMLFVSSRTGHYGYPKGHIDPGEDELIAARREIFEETGVETLKHIRKLGFYKRYRINFEGNEDKSELKTIHIHLFTTNQTLLKPLDPDNPKAIWVKFEDAPDTFFNDLDREFFLEHMKEVKDFLNS